MTVCEGWNLRLFHYSVYSYLGRCGSGSQHFARRANKPKTGEKSLPHGVFDQQWQAKSKTQ